MEFVRKSLKPNNVGGIFFTRLLLSCPAPAPLSEPVFRWVADTDMSGYSNNAIQYTILI